MFPCYFSVQLKMGKLKPSILTGMFSHLSMKQNKDKEYEDLRQISPKSKVKQKSKAKKLLDLSSKVRAIKPKNQKDAVLITPKKENSKKLQKSNKSLLRNSMQQLIDTTRQTFNQSVKYDEIVESPSQTPSQPSSSKREKYKNSKASSLRERMMKRLKAARFR